MAVSAVWSLQESSNSMLIVGKGIIHAATSDNIQPLALLVAEAFGNTLAICPQTQFLVEKLASARHVSHIVRFIQAQIGYAAHDSAYQLSLTGAGVRFLSLAAALLTFRDTFAAAQALDKMIKKSASENQISPTSQHLHDLLKALEYKLARSGFANSIAGWEDFIDRHPEFPAHTRDMNTKGAVCPAIEEIDALVDGFRRLERISDCSGLTITTTNCCPWLIAFTKWCLGAPPKVVTEKGVVLLDEPTSKVLLILKEGHTFGISVDVVHTVHGPSSLWCGQTVGREPLYWTGMLSLKSFSKRRLRDLNVNDERSTRPLVQIIPHALKIIKLSLRILPYWQKSSLLSSDAVESKDRPGVYQTKFPPEDYAAFAPSYWPPDREIYSIIGLFFNLDEIPDKLPMSVDKDLLALPYALAYVTELEKTCKCERCSGDASNFQNCAVDLFKSSVVSLARDILALSIFDSTESVLVAANSWFSEPPHLLPLKEAINNILFGNGDGNCTITDIFDSLLFLIGHDTSEEIHARMNQDINWVASARRGQVVYPIYLENAGPISRDLLKLGGGPGDIIYDNMRHRLVATHSEEYFASVTLHENIPIREPRNLLPDDNLEWRITKRDGYLELGFGITSTAIKMFNPMKAIWAASQSLYISSCPHSEESSGEVSDLNSIYVTPRYEGPPPELTLMTYVVGVAGNERLRFFALSGGLPAIIREKACLQCCIQICRLTGYTHVIA